MKSVPALTGVRGVAALWVVAYHVACEADSLGLPAVFKNSIFAHGWIAVDLFFILSGFMLMRVHGADFARIERRAVQMFVLQRVLRIYPLATVVLLMILVLTWCDPSFVTLHRAVHEERDFTLVPFVRTLLLATRWWTPDDGDWNEPVWSLSAEMIGYAAFPLLACLMSRFRQPGPALLLGFGAVAALVIASLQSGRLHDNDIGLWSLVRMSFCFSAGMALAQAERLMPCGRSTWAAHVTVAAGLALVLACVAPAAMGLALPACAALVFGLAFERGIVNASLVSRPATWLGEVSFPLYLVHVVPLLWLAETSTLKGAGPMVCLAALGGYIAFCLILARMLHLAVERPTHRFARRLTMRMQSSVGREPVSNSGPHISRHIAIR